MAVSAAELAPGLFGGNQIVDEIDGIEYDLYNVAGYQPSVIYLFHSYLLIFNSQLDEPSMEEDFEGTILEAATIGVQGLINRYKF